MLQGERAHRGARRLFVFSLSSSDTTYGGFLHDFQDHSTFCTMTTPTRTARDPNLTLLNTNLTPPPSYFSSMQIDGERYPIGAIFFDKRRAAAELSPDDKGPFTEADETLITEMNNEWEAMIYLLRTSNNPEAMELARELKDKTTRHELRVRNRIFTLARMDSHLLGSILLTAEPLFLVEAPSDSVVVGSALSESGSWGLTTPSSLDSAPFSPADSIPLTPWGTPLGSSVHSMATATDWYTPLTSISGIFTPVSSRLSDPDPLDSPPLSRANSDYSLSTLPCKAHSALTMITISDIERILKLRVHVSKGPSSDDILGSLSNFEGSRAWRESSKLSLNESADPTLFALRPVHERMFRHVISVYRRSASLLP